jgi:hypothetical protein
VKLPNLKAENAIFADGNGYRSLRNESESMVNSNVNSKELGHSDPPKPHDVTEQNTHSTVRS